MIYKLNLKSFLFIEKINICGSTFLFIVNNDNNHDRQTKNALQT